MALEELVLEEDGTTPLELEESGDDWATSTPYTTGDIVVHNGTVYEATADHTSGASTEPGVGVNWMTVWDAISTTTALEAEIATTCFEAIEMVGAASEYDFGDNAFVMNPDVAVPAGDIVIAWVTCTSHYFFGPNGEQIGETSFTDSAGNRWQQLVASYVDEAYVAMFASRLKYGLAPTDDIQLKHYGGGAKCIYLHRFTLCDGYRFALMLNNLAFGGSTAGTGSDPVAVTISGLDAARENLLLHVMGVEGPDTDTYTWDSDYTPIVGAGTTGHGTGGGAPPTSDYHVRGGYRIVTGITTDTVDVDSAIDRENDQALLSLVPVLIDEDYGDQFPNTPLIDDFNRADEDPIDGPGIWGTVEHPQFGDKWCQIISNEAAEGSGTSGGGSQYTVEEVLTDEEAGEFEVWATLAVAHLNDIGFGDGEGNSNATQAVGLGYTDTGQRAFNGGAPWDLGGIAFGDFTFGGEMPSSIVCWVWGARADGTKVGFQQLTDDIWTQHLWIDEGDGWEWVAATIRSTGVLVNAGFFLMAFENLATSRIDDFGGGPLERFRGRIIRRIPVAR